MGVYKLFALRKQFVNTHLESPADPSILIHTVEDPTTVHPVLFDRTNAVAICDAALRTEGAAGSSGIDASGWKRMCTSFQSTLPFTSSPGKVPLYHIRGLHPCLPADSLH